jgi:cysteinyl-tRNA synthetase
MDFIIKLRQEAKASKDYATSDLIRNSLQEMGFQLKDSKEGTVWSKS